MVWRSLGLGLALWGLSALPSDLPWITADPWQSPLDQEVPATQHLSLLQSHVLHPRAAEAVAGAAVKVVRAARATKDGVQSEEGEQTHAEVSEPAPSEAASASAPAAVLAVVDCGRSSDEASTRLTAGSTWLWHAGIEFLIAAVGLACQCSSSKKARRAADEQREAGRRAVEARVARCEEQARRAADESREQCRIVAAQFASCEGQVARQATCLEALEDRWAAQEATRRESSVQQQEFMRRLEASSAVSLPQPGLQLWLTGARAAEAAAAEVAEQLRELSAEESQLAAARLCELRRVQEELASSETAAARCRLVDQEELAAAEASAEQGARHAEAEASLAEELRQALLSECQACSGMAYELRDTKERLGITRRHAQQQLEQAAGSESKALQEAEAALLRERSATEKAQEGLVKATASHTALRQRLEPSLVQLRRELKLSQEASAEAALSAEQTQSELRAALAEVAVATLEATAWQADARELGQRLQEQECVVCLQQPSDTAILPCGHCCVCGPCGAAVHAARPPVCPMCRGDIAGVARIFT
mmetsp:Transcript_52345/g.148202  ORF Transcript_52345/g.148202 Transcript_52345/m.148202 type:complete len:541 (-) Transcript_52345:6-1628(-)